jgi:hypothetical protein
MPHGIFGLMVRVVRFDEQGRMANRHLDWARWFPRRKTLSGFLATELAIPAEEAAALAHEIVTEWPPEWEARGGEIVRLGIGERMALNGILAALAAITVFALAGVALSIWLFA